MGDTLNLDLSEMMPQLIEDMQNKLRERALQSLQWEVQAAITKTAKEYIDSNVIPAIKDELVRADAELRAAFVAAVRASTMALCEQMVAKSKERLASYEGAGLVAKSLELLFARDPS